MDIEHSLLLKITLVRINKSRDTPITYLKPKQIQCIVAASEQNDVLGIMPTGYGKSLIFQAIPIYQGLLQQVSIKTIVISPLNVIIDQQHNTLGTKALKVRPEVHTLLDGETDDDDDDSDVSDDLHRADWHQQALRQGHFQFLLGHPEDFLSKESMHAMRTSKWANEVKNIVIDEAHCVVQWSTDFRPQYRDLDQLRAIFPSAKYIALTATASVRMKRDILRLLNMQQAKIISALIDRVNTKYLVVQRPSNSSGVETSYTTIFVPVMEELKLMQTDFPKTVLYSTLKWCGYGNEIGVKILKSGDLSIAGVPEVAQFHAPLSAEVKKEIADRMAQKGGELRLLLATEAYGMGVDTPDIRRVMHAGPPCTLESYMQTTGRGGRDGEACQAILYFNNEDLGKETMTEEMRNFCRLDSCRRVYLSYYFGTAPNFTGKQHDCCDNCASCCTCDICVCANKTSTVDDRSTCVIPSHDNSTEVVIKEALLQVFDAINSSLHTLIDAKLYTGLTMSLATDIAANYEVLASAESLRLNYFYIKLEYINVIAQVLTSCKSFSV